MRGLSIFILLAVAARSVASPTVQPSNLPLPLGAAIRTALENNQNIKVEAYYPQIARANVLTALGQFDPALTFGRSYNRGYSYPTLPEALPQLLIEENTYSLALGGTAPTGLTYSIGATANTERGPYNHFTNDYATFEGVNLTQPLLRGFGFGANLVNVRVAKANRRISNWDYRQTLITTVTNVVIAYDNLVLAHHELGIAQHNRALAETLLEQNVDEVKIGNQPQSDVTTARAQVAEREEAILLAENTVRTYDNDLRQLMGERSFPRGQPLLTVEEPAVPDVTVDPASDLQEALTKRPDYQAARLGITIYRAQDAAAHNLLLPQLNLVAGYGYNGLSSNFAASRRMAEDQNNPSSSIGINISVPITNAVGRGTARAARLTLQQAEENLSLTEADIALDVANAASQIETTRQQVVADRTAYALANKSLDDEMKKFRDGTSSTLLVIQAQEILISVENSVANAVAAEFQAVATYDQQLGRTLDRYHIDAGGK